jgi:hypothetical protein
VNPVEEAAWTAAYEERVKIMEEAGVENAERKAILDTRRQYGIGPPWSWGHACSRGWVSDARFGPGQTVIPRTNRAAQRKRK